MGMLTEQGIARQSAKGQGETNDRLDTIAGLIAGQANELAELLREQVTLLRWLVDNEVAKNSRLGR